MTFDKTNTGMNMIDNNFIIWGTPQENVLSVILCDILVVTIFGKNF
jgi:hypothetical protein